MYFNSQAPPQECGILYVATVKTVVNKINVSAKLDLVLLILFAVMGFDILLKRHSVILEVGPSSVSKAMRGGPSSLPLKTKRTTTKWQWVGAPGRPLVLVVWGLVVFFMASYKNKWAFNRNRICVGVKAEENKLVDVI